MFPLGFLIKVQPFCCFSCCLLLCRLASICLARSSMMHTTLEGDCCGLERGGFRLYDNLVQTHSDGNSPARLVDPRLYFLGNPSTSMDSTELIGSNNLSPSPGTTISEGDFHEETDESDAVLKFISHILMEEELDSKVGMLQDASALQAFENSFSNALGPPSLQNPPHAIDLDVLNSVNSITPQSANNNVQCYTTILNLDDFNWGHADNPFFTRSQSDSWSPSSGCDTLDGLADSPVSILPISGLLSGRDSSVRKSGGGLEEASEPQTSNNYLRADLRNEVSLPAAPDGDALQAAIRMVETVGRHYSLDGSRCRKNHEREDNDYLEEERSTKHSAIYSVETELSDMFDKVLLCNETNNEPTICNNDEGLSQDEASKRVQQRVRGRKSRSKKVTKQNNSTSEMVDLTTLLTQCAQAVAAYDQRTALEQLKQIRQHSSPFGDASQRLAHCFANGLEARLAGTGGQVHTAWLPIAFQRTTASDIIKAYHVYISTCPFKRASHILANQTIMKQSMKATSLHIIDFGILFGFQWPCLIQFLSKRPGGPPKLRITGIELPRAGFRPAERVEETGRRLADYCRRFSVPFEYIPIAQKWETIRAEDLKIGNDEFLVVNCLYRFRYLFDETVIASSPRDIVLDLIRSINPNIFIHGVVNGTYNAPFFVTRFREALFHFSAVFDMFEACLPREDEARMLFETEIFGSDAMNAIACEGAERFERPETYKQWQVRNVRAGFRKLPLDQDILKGIRARTRANYHKDFVVDENSHWLLLGWKGRIIHALSCWKPA